MEQRAPLNDEQRIRAAQALLSTSSFQLIEDILYDIEIEAINELRRPDRGMDTSEPVLQLRTVDLFRQHIRALASHAGVKYEFGRQVP